MNKYSPTAQDKYSMKISSDLTNKKEEFIAGSEHYWVAQYEYPNGEISEPKTVTTEELFLFKKEQEAKPEKERIRIKFKRG